MGPINVIKLLQCPLNTKQCSAVDESLCDIKNKSSGTRRIEPGAAVREVQMLPLCYATRLIRRVFGFLMPLLCVFKMIKFKSIWRLVNQNASTTNFNERRCHFVIMLWRHGMLKFKLFAIIRFLGQVWKTHKDKVARDSWSQLNSFISYEVNKEKSCAPSNRSTYILPFFSWKP